ncbi:hypothetical protein LTR95_009367 [Oleoguttula sp. CCFEE 5521]
MPQNTIMALFLFCLLIASATIAALQRPYIPALKPPTHPFPAIQIRSETTSAGSINMGVLNGVASTGTTSSSMVMIDINTFDPVLPTGTDLASLTTAIGNNNFDVTSIGMINTGGTTTFQTIMGPTGVPAPLPTITSASGAPFPFLNISTFRAPTHTMTISQASTASINCANPANAYEVFYCALQHTSTTSTSIVGRAPTTMLTLPSATNHSVAGRDPLATKSESVPSITRVEPSIASSATLPTHCTPGPDASSMLACMESSLSAMLSKAMQIAASISATHG